MLSIKRTLMISAALLGTTLVAACGSSNSSSGSGGGPGGPLGFNRNGAVGELVSVKGNTLTVSSASGTDTTVITTSSTTVVSTKTSSLSSLSSGDCAMVTGQKDSTKNVNAVSLTFFAPTSSGSCTPTGIGSGRSGSTPRPRPSFSPRPGATAGTPRYSGKASSITGSGFTLTPSNGSAVTVVVATTTTVMQRITEAVSSLNTGDCVAAQGQRQSNGDVRAQTIAVSQPGPSGCTSGFGGGRFGGGGGGGGFPGGPANGAGGANGVGISD